MSLCKKVIINCRTHETSAWQHMHLSTRALRHITKSSSAAGLMMTLLYVETHVWTGACVAKTTSSVSPAADDDFVICRNARVDRHLCCQTHV